MKPYARPKYPALEAELQFTFRGDRGVAQYGTRRTKSGLSAARGNQTDCRFIYGVFQAS